MLKKKYSRLIAVMSVCFIIAFSVPMVAAVPPVDTPRGPPTHVNDNDPGMIWVVPQEMFYFTIVPYAGDGLVYNGHNGGSFQQLWPNGGPDDAPYTLWGPGDVGYRGGRWWIDNGAGPVGMDPTDTFFLCPLTLKAPGLPAS